LKATEKGPIGRHFLALTQKLMPLRIACAGGRIPLDDVPIESEEKDEDGNDDDNDEDSEDAPKKKKPKKFSKFAFTSKLKTLVSELERLRTDDPTGTFRVWSLVLRVVDTHTIDMTNIFLISSLVLFILFSAKSLVFSQFTSTLQWLKEELPNHGFQFRTLSGDMTMKNRAKALSEFQNDPPTTIFLCVPAQLVST
jgi:SNF2 family DNA or RNA helicase